jgi:NitT/TauT family transport system substrate-binding protein
MFEKPLKAGGTQIAIEALARADLVAAMFIAGNAKLGVLPPNVAAKIAASGKDIQIAAVLGTGMLRLITNNPGLKRLEDLRGKTVEMAGHGATPDYVFRWILNAKGIRPDRDITLRYTMDCPEIAQSLIYGRVSLALLPEPFGTMALLGRPSLRVIGDIQSEWIAAGGKANYPMTVLVVDAEFARFRPDVVRAVLNACQDSIRWVTVNPAKAGTLAENYDLGMRAPVVRAAIPQSGYEFIPAQEAKAALESLFKLFLNYAPSAIGGVLPKDSFYYQYQ